MSEKISIYYATETGNSEDLANRTGEKLRSLGFDVSIENVSDISADSLADVSKAIFVVSTWGDGEPPFSAEDFGNAVINGNLDYSKMSFAVLALGDTGYDDFCGFGRKLEEAIVRQGGKTFLARKDLDIDFEDDYQKWSDDLVAALQ